VPSTLRLHNGAVKPTLVVRLAPYTSQFSPYSRYASSSASP